MAQQSNSKNDKLPIKVSPEERFLDLWEDNIRLIATNGQVAKLQFNND